MKLVCLSTPSWRNNDESFGLRAPTLDVITAASKHKFVSKDTGDMAVQVSELLGDFPAMNKFRMLQSLEDTHHLYIACEVAKTNLVSSSTLTTSSKMEFEISSAETATKFRKQAESFNTLMTVMEFERPVPAV